MQKILLAGLVVLMGACGPASLAVAAPYVSMNLGATWVDDSALAATGLSAEMSSDTGFGISAAVGNSYGQIRAEVEMAYRSNDLNEISSAGVSVPVDGYIDSMALLANLLVDLELGTSFKPFVGAGVGVANVESELTAFGSTGTADDTVLAYQLIAGVGFPMSPATTLELQYRFFGTDEPELDGISVEYQTQNVFAGLRFNF